MDLICYVDEGWLPLIRPAPATRPWMDATPESFAYRCLPLNIANAHGWEVLSPCGFEATWNGAMTTNGISITPDWGSDPHRVPVSIFGQGVLSFHFEGLVRTPPGWNLWVGGSPNRIKDGIQPLNGIIETDWSPFSFTMNWRFTRHMQRVRFEKNEPFCFFFPVQRRSVEAFEPRFVPLADDPQTYARYHEWKKGRDVFHDNLKNLATAAPADRWQKHYYRGVDASGAALTDDHQAKLRLKPFDASKTPHLPVAPDKDG